MAVTIDWGTKVINVPKSDLTLVQSTPTEIYDMDINWFRMQLKDLEDSVEGIPHPDTHRHNTEVTVGGLTLARVVELINGYTVTFEDGQYAVNLVGANSNIGDKVNVNNVSVRSQNSAGMTSSPSIEHNSFNGGVTIDVVNGVEGTVYPTGTPIQPVNNVQDAVLIAEYRRFSKIYVIGDITLTTGDNLDDYIIEGENANRTTITIETGASINGTEFIEASVTGVLDGGAIIRHCKILDLEHVDGIIFESMLTANTIKLTGNNDLHMLDCYSGIIGTGTPTIDFNGSGSGLGLRSYAGGIKLTNKSGNDSVSIDLDSGQIKLSNTVTGGTIVCRGVGQITEDNSNGATIINQLVNPDTIAKETWLHKKALTVAKFLGLK